MAQNGGNQDENYNPLPGDGTNNQTRPGRDGTNNQTIPGKTPNKIEYRIFGTNEPYSGMVLQVGTDYYTTIGGAKEGNASLLDRISIRGKGFGGSKGGKGFGGSKGGNGGIIIDDPGASDNQMNQGGSNY